MGLSLLNRRVYIHNSELKKTKYLPLDLAVCRTVNIKKPHWVFSLTYFKCYTKYCIAKENKGTLCTQKIPRWRTIFCCYLFFMRNSKTNVHICSDIYLVYFSNVSKNDLQRTYPTSSSTLKILSEFLNRNFIATTIFLKVTLL